MVAYQDDIAGFIDNKVSAQASVDYEQSRALDYFEEGGQGERLEINTLLAVTRPARWRP